MCLVTSRDFLIKPEMQAIKAVVADNTAVAIITQSPEKFVPDEFFTRLPMGGKIPGQDKNVQACFQQTSDSRHSGNSGIIHLNSQERKQVKDQVTFDSMVAGLETVTLKSHRSLTTVTANFERLSGLPKVLAHISDSPVMLAKTASGFVSGLTFLSYSLAPKGTKVIAEATNSIIKPVEKTIPKISKSLARAFPQTTKIVGKVVPYASVISSASFAVSDTYNANQLIHDKRASKATKNYAIATASISWVGLAAASALTLSPLTGKAAPFVAAFSGGTGILAFGTSIFTSVKMEFAKNKDGIN